MSTRDYLLYFLYATTTADVLSTGRAVVEFTDNTFAIRPSVYANTADDIRPEEL